MRIKPVPRGRRSRGQGAGDGSETLLLVGGQLIPGASTKHAEVELGEPGVVQHVEAATQTVTGNLVSCVRPAWEA